MVTFLPRLADTQGATEVTCARTSVMPGWKHQRFILPEGRAGLADYIIRDFQFSSGGSRADDHVRKQRAVDDVGLVLIGKFRHYLRAALRVGAVVLDDDLDRPAIDAAGIADRLHGGAGRASRTAPQAAPMPVLCAWKPILIGAELAPVRSGQTGRDGPAAVKF